MENGGIVGRGVLLDYARWRAETGKDVAKANAYTVITIEELEEVAKHQNLELKTGDILIVRTGFTPWHESASAEERAAAFEAGAFIGVETSMKSVKWLWNHHFAAVTCDTLSFEVSPVPLAKKELTLHEWLLTHWGMPIG